MEEHTSVNNLEDYPQGQFAKRSYARIVVFQILYQDAAIQNSPQGLQPLAGDVANANPFGYFYMIYPEIVAPTLPLPRMETGKQ